jgi:hypothetical protein
MNFVARKFPTGVAESLNNDGSKKKNKKTVIRMVI